MVYKTTSSSWYSLGVVKTSPSPTQAFTSLLTPVTPVQIHSGLDGQAYAGNEKARVPSFNVVNEWPRSKLCRSSALADGQFLCPVLDLFGE
jgi:hypothetical protein